ncbi:hypothetical protein K402DRAFT_393986 [Aulographum hederae CBS 113979]|uniref:Uncharacterized protein n=1 Tax=Aulographum hederae CBS 113979 TaxID=1176131 RepID=A0A6G1GYU1_9PEZI|nr:hypothetical protein K402DRAFT_393986 [Aulographum hederae CBS 113979]
MYSKQIVHITTLDEYDRMIHEMQFDSKRILFHWVSILGILTCYRVMEDSCSSALL